MRGYLLSLSAVLLAAAAAGPQHAAAQEAVTFTCIAAAGHVCQFAVRTGGGQINFALPSGETKEVPGVLPHLSTYCVCDPGPVTPDCRQPRLDMWCLGSWTEVYPGVNSENDFDRHLFAIVGRPRAD
ncbi:MAG TPA: hypothetical protein VMI72_13170 [Roseiarcus sp.]|nr:hypothetical protein [Roseiarcus sp.]